MNMNIPTLATLQEVSKSLQVSTHTIRAWVRKGKLHPVRICRKLLFEPAELYRFVAAGQKKTSAQNPSSDHVTN